MTKQVVSAPGKLVIAGEYAVLEGHEALAMSVDRRARVSFSKNGHGSSLDNSVVDCVAQEFQARGFILPLLKADIDSSELHVDTSDDSIKLGIGSSSAVTVALTAAWMSELGRDLHSNLCFEIALSAHKRFTHGLGSGIDVATSFFGGAIRYKQPIDRSRPIVEPCTLTVDPHCLVAVHTGMAQSTGVFLKHLNELKQTRPEHYEQAIMGIAHATQRIIMSMKDVTSTGQQWSELCAAVHAHNENMTRLGYLANIDIFCKPHLKIAALTERHGGIAKPSGAGGGDMSLCFIRPENKTNFLYELKENSFTAVDLKLCGAGVE